MRRGDEDCDGQTDEPDASDAVTLYADDDRDGYGAGAASTGCLATGYATNDTDCEDGAANAYPGASELSCDDLDNDCSGGEVDVEYADAYDKDAYDGGSTSMNNDDSHETDLGVEITSTVIPDINLHNSDDVDWFTWTVEEDDGSFGSAVTVTVEFSTVPSDWEATLTSYNGDGDPIGSPVTDMDYDGHLYLVGGEDAADETLWRLEITSSAWTSSSCETLYSGTVVVTYN